MNRPSVDKMSMPVYSSKAIENGIAGPLDVKIVVDVSGTVVSAEVTTPLDKVHGLEEQAMFAISKWTFKPGTLKGQAVAVALTCQFRFMLTAGKGFVGLAGITP